MSAYRDALTRALDARPDNPGTGANDCVACCFACRGMISAIVGALWSVDPDLASRLARATLPHLEGDA